ncbi:MAG TPA: SAM-dependent methyltransferase [Acidimicrobiales bacterium]|jgi:methyltransferase (TIGR00027 family)|nr:SAM-dependent methyltransferase [Acidimicrobiales bacterium]
MRAGHPLLAARWVAAQRLRLERTRPSTPDGDVDAEHRLYRAIAGGMSVPVGRASALAQRTQVIDAEVARALGRGTTQIVLLGAGGDGRALRFAGGATRWFEVDRPQAQADKRRRLDALNIVTTGTRYVGLDLLSDDLGDALEAAGHEAGSPSLFISEGLFDALTLEATAAACSALRDRAAPDSVLVATFAVEPPASGPVRALRSATGVVRQATDDPRRNDFRPDDPQKLMVVTGWRVTHAESSAERRLDPGAHMLILVSEPDTERGG